jgi:hypothetical protein
MLFERGTLLFLYRPRVGVERVRGVDDVQRFMVVLEPDGKRRARELIIGRKRMPDPATHEREWAFVADAAEELEAVRDAEHAGEAGYALVTHEDHTHLEYVLHPPAPDRLQRRLGIRREASYVVEVRNPDAPAPRGAGLPESRRADFPPALRERFGDRRFIPLDPPDLLDHVGVELVLIGAGVEARHAR